MSPIDQPRPHPNPPPLQGEGTLRTECFPCANRKPKRDEPLKVAAASLLARTHSRNNSYPSSEEAVILTDKKTADTRATQAVDIVAFVEAQEIPFYYFEKPYYLAPLPGGEKLYALLRETLRRTRKVGIAYVVIQMRRQLAALVPRGKALVLNILRYSSQTHRFDIPCFDDEEIAEADISESELIAAARLVESMTEQWEALRANPGPQFGSAALESQTQPKTVDPEELLKQAEEESFDVDAMDARWGRPHRRRPQDASRIVGHRARRRRSS